jgi:hypothetical protein
MTLHRVMVLKALITAAIVLYFVHPILPTLGSLVWLWMED